MRFEADGASIIDWELKDQKGRVVNIPIIPIAGDDGLLTMRQR